MKINADFSARAAVHTAKIDWVPSPIPEVERKMLDRIGEEVARATTIVRYAPGSHFPAHTHGGGEEFLVLDGIFQDEHGDYPVGTYVRNPPTSSHAPASGGGCTILVKLWQFDPEDRTQIVVDTKALTLVPTAERPGVAAATLFRDTREWVRMEEWGPGVSVALEGHGGLEILCLEGSFMEGDERFEQRSWLRLPADMPLSATAGASGCRIWLKQDHLRGLD